MKKLVIALVLGILGSIIAYVIIQSLNRPTPPPIDKEQQITVQLEDKNNFLQNEGNCILKYLSKNKDNQLNINIELNGLKANHFYLFTINGKPGEFGNDHLKRFNKTDGEGYYDFEEVKTDDQGNLSGDFTVRHLPKGTYKVKFLVKDKNDYKVVLLQDNLYFSVE